MPPVAGADFGSSAGSFTSNFGGLSYATFGSEYTSTSSLRFDVGMRYDSYGGGSGDFSDGGGED